MKLCHFAVKIIVDNGKYTLRSEPSKPHTAHIEFTSDFSNATSPSDTSITIHGLKRETAANFYNGATVALFAGFYNADYTENNVSYIMGGTVTQVQPLFNDGGDWQLQFTVQDGAKYNEIPVLKTKVSRNVRVKASLRGNPKIRKHYERQIKAIEESFKNDRSNYETKLRNEKVKNREVLIKKYNEYLSKKEANQKKEIRTSAEKNAKKANEESAKLESSKKKWEYKPIHFPKKTKGKTIITTIAKKAGIKLQRLKLKKNKVYKHGYTANKKPFQCLQDIANDCGTDVMYVHGGLSIAPFSSNKKLAYVATKTSGLINPPQLQVDDNTDTANASTNNSKTKKEKKKAKFNKISPTQAASQALKNGTFQATIALNPLIATGAIFRISDRLTHFSDWVVATSGEHSYSSGSTPTTQVTFELLSKYQSDEGKKNKTLQTQEKKKELAKDKQARHAAKSVRHTRTRSRIGGR